MSKALTLLCFRGRMLTRTRIARTVIYAYFYNGCMTHAQYLVLNYDTQRALRNAAKGY